MVSKQIIEECAKEGIVPGAVIRCLADSYDIITVPETSEWLIHNGDLYFETSGLAIVIRRYGNGPFATVITPAPSSETLDPGMATKCGPAMRAAIMERAKELGLMDPSSKEKDTTEGIWVMDFGLQKGMLHPCTIVNSMGLTVIPTPEFLRLMENTKPPKKEHKEDLHPNDDPWAALIQTLVNALDRTEDLDNGCPLPTWQKGYDEMCDMRSNALDAAKEQGFTPTEG